jgi:hypothetical protein
MDFKIGNESTIEEMKSDISRQGNNTGGKDFIFPILLLIAASFFFCLHRYFFGVFSVCVNIFSKKVLLLIK